MESYLLQARQPPIPEKVPKKKDVLLEIFVERVVPVVTKPPQEKALPESSEQEVIPVAPDPSHEILTETEVFEPDLAPAIEETKSESISLPQEIEKSDAKGDVSIIPLKVPNRIETVSIKPIIAYYPFELDEVSLVWRRSRQHQVETFLNFEDQLVKPKVSNNVFHEFVLHQDPEKLNDFQVNSRSSSFKEGVSDTDRFRVVSQIFREFWKSRKRAQKKGKILQQNKSYLATRGYGWRRENIVVRFASVSLGYLISSEQIAFISLFKYFIS